MFRLTFVLILATIFGVALGHVRLRTPPNRSSIWRDPAFNHLKPPKNYDDDGLYCGTVHQPEITKDCGICGDPFSTPTPRANEHGGTYGQGHIVATYKSGNVIPINVEFTTTHQGYFEMHLCRGLPETEKCFEKLNFGDGSSRVKILYEDQTIWVNTTVQLPNVKCDHCILRLHYRAGNNWGDCGDGTEGMGCGLQETFRSCADITIN